MLSIQQLIKALRKLQNSAATGVDLVKSLKHAAAITTTQIPPASLLSALEEHDDEVTSSTSPKQPATSNSSQQQQQQQQLQWQQTQASTKFSSTASVSLTSHSNDSSSTTQDSIKATAKAASSKSLPSHHLQRSQQIQNFYQQQLHHFHTQHNQSLNAKQKQTQFAMSSLAAEPLVALKQDDIAASAGVIGNGHVSSGATAHSDESTSSKQHNNSSGKPCFSTGFSEILQFMELIGNLKHTKRTGWVLRDVNDCESISGHMYRMSMMTFLLDGSEGLNQIRCMELALVHDLAESLVGDITPFCGVSKEDKRAMEFKAMDDICKLIEPRGKRIMELFEEYEHGESAESKFVKDLDRLDMVMQAFEYEKRDNCLLKHQEFFDSTEGKFNHPFVKKLVEEIYEQRKNLAKAKGATPPPSIVVPTNDGTAAATVNGHAAASTMLANQKKSSTSS